MAIQYKPTKQKKEKSAKAPKAPKEPKAIKIGSATQMKTAKPAKAPKAPKAPKPEKVKAFAPAFKGGKVEKVADLEKKSVLKKNVNPVVFISVAVVLVVAAVLVMTVALPAIEEKGLEIQEIMISSTPNKMIYFTGEQVDYEGLRVTVTRKNGESFVVDDGRCQISGFDSTEEGYKTITVNYEGFTSTFSVKVETPPRPTPALRGITLGTLPKTEYKVGEWLDTTDGVILREYVDGSVLWLPLVNSYVFGFVDVKGPGEYELTVRYEENGITAETTYTITVTE